MDTNKGKGLFKKAVNLITMVSFLIWNLAAASPQGGSVAQGSATITQSGSTTTVTQTSSKAVINWGSFDTASNEAVNFVQPNSSSIALNRINSGQPTNFNGSLSANGQIWILNPSGILFGSSSKIDVAGLLATTHNITDANFMAGNYKFDLVPGSENSSVINNGLISAKDSGIVALVAPYVQNNGLIQVSLGTVALSTGASFVLDMYGDSLINFGSNAPIQSGAVSNAGKIIANGGKVFMTANYASGVLDNMISMSGSIEAKSVGVNSKGQIILYGGNYQTKKLAGVTKVSGKLDASDIAGGSNGGFIETSGEYVVFDGGAAITPGLGGTWSLDPNDISIVAGATCTNPSCANPYTATGASTVGADFIQGILITGANVTLNASGNITINTPLAIGGPYTVLPPPIQPTLTLNAGGDINIEQQITNASSVTHLYMFLNAGQSLATGSIHIDAPILMPPASGGGGYLNFTAGTAGAIYVNTPLIEAGTIALVNLQEAFGFVFNSPVILQQNATFDGSFGHSMFNSTIDNCTGVACVNGPGPFSLTITSSTGLIDFGGNIGANFPLASLTVNASTMRATGTLSSITTTGAQIYDPNFFFFGIPGVTFNATKVTLNNGLDNNNGSGAITFNSDLELTGTFGLAAPFIVPGPVTVTGSTILNNSVMYSGTGTAPIYFEGPVTVAGNAQITGFVSPFGTGSIHFGSTVNGTGSLTLNNAFLPVGRTYGNVLVDNVIDTSSMSSFAIDGGSLTLNGGTIIQNNQTYSIPVDVTVLGGTLTDGGTVTFTGSTLQGPGGLTINGNAIFNIDVGTPTALGSLYVSGSTQGATVTTTGNQDYIGPYTLTQDDTLTSTAGSINFHSTVGGNTLGPWALTVDAFSDVTIDNNIGSSSDPLRTLDVTAGDRIFVNSLALSTLDIKTTGNQTYTGTVVLTTSFINPVVTLASTDVASDITFNNQITLTNPAQEMRFFVNAGHDINFKSDILLGDTGAFTGGYVNATAGDKIFLGTLGNSATLNILGGNVDIGSFILEGLDFNSPVWLNQNTSLSAVSIRMNSTIDANAGCSPACSLTTGGVVVEFHGNIGQTGALGSLTTGIGENFIDFFGPMTTVTTIGDQVYNDVVVSFGVSQLDFVVINPLNSAFFNTSNTRGTPTNAVIFANNLSVPITVNGNAVFNGDVRYNLPGAIIVTGTTVLNGSTMRSASQDYQGAVTLNGSQVTLDATGPIHFGSTIEGTGADAQSLVINSNVGPSSTVQFDGNVGDAVRLNLLDVRGSQIRIGSGEINTFSNQIYHDPVLLLGNVDAPGLLSQANITFDSTVDGGFNLDITANQVRFKNIVGGTPLDALTVTANVINFDSGASSVTSTGTQTYIGSGVSPLMTMNADPVFTAPNFIINIPVLINANTTYTSTAGNIDFQQAITGDGVSSLTLNPTGGSAIFENTVGTLANPLGSLTVNGTTLFDQGSAQNVYTNGDQIYVGLSEIDNDVYLEALTTGLIELGTDSAGFFDNPSNSHHLNAITHNATYGATGQGITGHVDVGSFTVGGEGGANVSPISKDSVVNGNTGDAAFMAWVINPKVSNTFYCINDAAGCFAQPSGPNNIPQTEVFNPLTGLPVCGEEGCNNLITVVDNLLEAGVVSCGGGLNGAACQYGFAQAEDTNGKLRILLPGDVVYAGDKILKDESSCMCVKSLYSKKRTCMGPGKNVMTYEH